MEKLIAGPLAEALSANRDRFNGLVAQALHNTPGLDTAGFRTVVREYLQPVVDAVETAAPQRAAKVAGQLFEICLTLFAQGYLGPGSRTPLVTALWQHLLPAVPHILASTPRRVAGSLSNAAVNIGHEETGTGQRWLKRLHALAPAFETLEQLLDASLVLAWRAGLPHFRETALEHWQKLPDSLKILCMGIGADEPHPAMESLLQALSNPWHPPHLAGRQIDVKLVVVGKAGRFKGLGGQFGEPPLVAGDGTRIIGYDGEGSFSVWADCFGVSLRRTVPGSYNVAGQGFKGFSIDKSGTVSCGALRLPFPPLAVCSSFASTPSTLAVTLPHSHSIYLVAPLVTERKP